MITTLLALAVCVPFSLAAEPSKKTNVVLVMADDQGWGDMAYNGHPHLKTPHFDEFARTATRFNQFYAAAPVCSPTRASVMTGRTPNRLACFKWGHPLRPQEETIAQILKKAGYRTGHFGKWHLGSVQAQGKATPGQAGFDTWISAPNFFDLNPILSVAGKAKPFQGDTSDITAQLALDFMKDCTEKKQPFLAVVWFGSPHAPHQALPSDAALYEKLPKNQANFLGEISAMDRAVGKLRASIKDLKIRENTIFWYCSDNGALPKVGSSGDRRGNKGTVYQGGLMVPSLLEWPDRFPQPQVINTPAITSDILPTIVELCGLPSKFKHPLDGMSLVPILEQKIKDRPKPLGFWDHPTKGIGTPSKEWMEELLAAQKAGQEPMKPNQLFVKAGNLDIQYPTDSFPGHSAWIDGDWKLHRLEKDKKIRWELYDLKADPKEKKNLFESETTRAEAMKLALESWLKSVVNSLNGKDYQAK